MNQSEDQRIIPKIVANYDDATIYCPGSIQPHGILLALDPSDLTILQISQNTPKYLGIEPQALLNTSLQNLLDQEQIFMVKESLGEELGQLNVLKLLVQTLTQRKWFDGLIHQTKEAIILELEPTSSDLDWQFWNLQASVRGIVTKLRQVSELESFLEIAVQEIHHLTGFDRTLVYQFDEQGAGCVVAETKASHLPSFLNLHYPATDIPENVRRIYHQSLIRFIPNLTSAPVDLFPKYYPLTHQSLDLTFAVLRSVHPCCVEYHQNIGALALLVVPLIHNNRLWGLLTGHHSTPKNLSTEVLMACELLGQVISVELAQKVTRQDWQEQVQLQSLKSKFITSISQADNFIDALIQPKPNLLKLVNAQGAAVCLGEEITCVGDTPPQETISGLITWLSPQVKNNLFSTHCLPRLYPPAEHFKNLASGILVLQISQVQGYYILWFRPEVLTTVTWAGDPQQTAYLSPRTSFEKWQETVRLTSLPWKGFELENALDLRNAIVGIVLKQGEELARINQALEQSNRELDSFAYAASHDLKEPLRGIHNYSTFLLEDYCEILDEAGVNRLQTIVNLTQRMEKLIDVLLRFSRLGQGELNCKWVDLNTIVRDVLSVLSSSRHSQKMKIRIPRPLPKAWCDSVLIGEVFSNLLSNAFKYNNQPDPWIEIGYLDSEEGNLELGPTTVTYYVRDNGIGIRVRHQDLIFRLFKRLHSQRKYGGGTGAGLTITQKILERHHGKIWVESTYGEGSTFYFTLAEQKD